MQKNDPRSLGMLTLSMIIFGSIGIFRRYIPLPSATLACFRGLSGALLLYVAAAVGKKKPDLRMGAGKLLRLALTGALIGLNWIFLFEAYNHTTVATATLCYYMQPTIVILLSPLFFGERITGKKCVCVVLSLIGMVLVSGLADSGMPRAAELKGVAFGLTAAVLYASVIIMNKKLPGLDAYAKTIVQLLGAAVVLIPYLLLVGLGPAVAWTPTVVVMLLVVGVVHTGIAYALYFGSMDGLRAQTVAILSYLDPIVALVLSALILKERMTAFGVLGAALIIGAALLSETGLKKET